MAVVCDICGKQAKHKCNHSNVNAYFTNNIDESKDNVRNVLMACGRDLCDDCMTTIVKGYTYCPEHTKELVYTLASKVGITDLIEKAPKCGTHGQICLKGWPGCPCNTCVRSNAYGSTDVFCCTTSDHDRSCSDTHACSDYVPEEK